MVVCCRRKRLGGGAGQIQPRQTPRSSEQTTRIAALTTTQTGGRPPAGLPSRTVDAPDDELNPAVLSMMGLDPNDFKEGNSNV
jgi:hypothetical protein